MGFVQVLCFRCSKGPLSLNEHDPDDDLYPEAASTAGHGGEGSTSELQRRLKIGYARVARLPDALVDSV